MCLEFMEVHGDSLGIKMVISKRVRLMAKDLLDEKEPPAVFLVS